MRLMRWALLALISSNAALADEAAYAACASCHGAQAQGNPAMSAPALAGQDSAYIMAQLNNFKKGIRGAHEDDQQGKMMAIMAKSLTEQTMTSLGAYLADLPPAVSQPSEGNPVNGNNIYQNSCGGCHGLKAEGNPLLKAPRLSSLDAKYLNLQYQNFAEGVRGAHPDDRYGRQMAFMTSAVTSEKQLRDIIAFITSQQ